MFTAQQYRSKALEYEVLLKTAGSPGELAEYRDLQQSYTSLADNLDWLAANAGKTVASRATGAPNVERGKRHAERVEEEKILRCLGAAVILNWNTIPPKLQRALFEAASSIQDAQTASPKEALARFLHDHKDDAQRELQNQNGARAQRRAQAALPNRIVKKKEYLHVAQILDRAEGRSRASHVAGRTARAIRSTQAHAGSDRDAGDPIYRIKSSDETYERVAQESDLTASRAI